MFKRVRFERRMKIILDDFEYRNGFASRIQTEHPPNVIFMLYASQLSSEVERHVRDPKRQETSVLLPDITVHMGCQVDVNPRPYRVSLRLAV